MTTMQTAVDSVNHYVSKGVPKDGAVAIISCLWYESKLNPGSQGVQSTEHGGALNTRGAFGIASWNGPRQAALQAFAQKKGLDPAALNTQLDFVLTECANSYHAVWAAITSQDHYSQIIPIFVAQYENPANHQAEINGAMAFAEQIYANPAILSGPPSTPVPNPVSVPVPAPAPIAPTPTPTPTPTVEPIVNPAVITSIITIIADIVAIIKQLSPVLAALHTPATPTPTTHTPATPAPATTPPLVLPADPALATVLQQILAAVAALSPPQGAK